MANTEQEQKPRKKRGGKCVIFFLGGLLAVVALLVLVFVLADDTPRAPTATPGPTPTSGPTPTLTPYPAPAIRISAENLIGEWDSNEMAADEKYPGQLIDVFGVIVDVEEKSARSGDAYEVTLAGGLLAYVDCSFSAAHRKILLTLQAGQTVTVRGIVSRGSTVMVKMTNCVIPPEQ